MPVTLHDSLLRTLLHRVYFINGTAYAGKSTMVRMLAQKHGGIHCGENYHMPLQEALSPEEYPNLCYFQTMRGWDEFLRRTPEEYAAWIEGSAREAVELEIALLIRLTAEDDRPVFVDTNIPVDILRRIAEPHHVAILLSPPETSVNRFFDRSDPEKQFLLRTMEQMPDAQAVLDNFRACLARINSPKVVAAFAGSGFYTLMRDDARSPEDTLRLLEEHFQLN
ncbi:MAG: hypothetical protein ACI4MJ_01345 [Aristaeellaceae bacterium]